MDITTMFVNLYRRHRNPHSPHRFAPAVILLLLHLSLISTTALGQNRTQDIRQNTTTQDTATYRQLLLDVATVVEVTADHYGIAGMQPSDFELARSYIQQLSDDELQFMLDNGLSTTELQARLDVLNQLLAQLPLNGGTTTTIGDGNTRNTFISTTDMNPFSATDAIEFPVPEVAVDDCADTQPVVARASLAVKTTLEATVEGLKWPCRQAVFGFNSALGCLGPEILAQAAGATFRGASFCLSEQSAADVEARLETERNIGTYLNAFIDATTSSRATQDSLDNVQTDTTTALDQLTTLQTDIDTRFPVIETQLDNTLSGLDGLAAQLDELVARTQDLQFRTQVNQVDIEDIQIRSADLQQSALEIRSDTQALISTATTANSNLQATRTNTNSRWRQTRRDAIAMVLSDPGGFNIRYQTPATQGGELEEVREVTIQAIQIATQLGLPTTEASSVLSNGDQAYAQQNYAAAYAAFAEAYRLVVAASTSVPLTRDNR